MKRSLSSFATTIVIAVTLAGCQSASQKPDQQDATNIGQASAATPSQPALPVPESIEFDCSFDLKPYLPDAPRLELKKLSDLFVWINTRVKGGLLQNPGKRLASMVESDYWGVKSEKDSQFFRAAWLIPLNMTQDRYSMNVVLERRGSGYVVTRVDDTAYQQLLGFLSEEGVRIGNLIRKNIGYCDKLPES